MVSEWTASQDTVRFVDECIRKSSMELPTDRPVAVFDLDGCLLASVSSVEIKERDYWIKIWSDPHHKCNTEIIELVKALTSAGWHIAILSARNEAFWDMTIRWLANQFNVFDMSLTLYPNSSMMSGATYKAYMIAKWKQQGVRVMFMVEDFPPNAREVRQHVPVLMYEMVKQRR